MKHLLSFIIAGVLTSLSMLLVTLDFTWFMYSESWIWVAAIPLFAFWYIILFISNNENIGG